ncbi:MAG: bifunctional diaminohydroxyphosphoribosylaminopyrimidine deaminase/5-amino-6-(5-phosphoribosylamino)uracil reductase RibD [Deltaproteobacteria bacterium]|nr:bifunctional diaminohydroxyphosphoribosylaminopyrimidine deaminase/5-amino-6-(5-phosphoribosylamino)uracil reductase RibD [Deltaproteobacteria bacterium]
MSPVDVDERYLREALRVARRGAGLTSPNPMVGAVLVKAGKVVGRGHHARAGASHAEIIALQKAGDAARGATLYLNLEPCAHQGRTPPCVDAVIAAEVARVVVGMIDPNPLVNGRGVRRLQRAGVEVRTGVLKDECEALNEAFISVIQRGRPLVTLKSALTLDGHVATRRGDSRWVSGSESREVGHQLRALHDVIMVGVGTVLADNPELTCRAARGGRDPIRVVLDSQLQTPPRAKIVRATEESTAPTLIITTRRSAVERAAALERAGAKVVRVKSRRGRVDLSAALEALKERGVLSVLVEGGPTLAGGLWKEQLVDRVETFIAPKVLGDAEALPMLFGAKARRMQDAVEIESSVRMVGDDVLISGRVRWPRKDV